MVLLWVAFLLAFPAVAQAVSLSSITLNPSTVVGGNNSTGTATLDAPAPTGGALVTLSSSDTTAATVPASVTVPKGQTTRTFTVTTKGVATTTSVIVSGTYGVTRTATLTVNPADLTSVTLSKATIVGGNNFGSNKVNLNGKAPTGGAQVTLSSSNTAAATVPSSVTVPAGATSKVFTVTTLGVAANIPVTISATYRGVTKQATFTVTPADLTSVTLSPATIVGGNSSTANKVNLNGKAPTGGAQVTLSSSNTAVATVPSSVTVAAQAKFKAFTITTHAVASTTMVTISATYRGITKQATLTVNPGGGPATLSGLTLNPTTVDRGNDSTGTVTLSGQAPSGGAVIALSSLDTLLATVPVNVTVAAGATSAPFTVKTSPNGANLTVDIQASYLGLTRTVTLTLPPLSPVRGVIGDRWADVILGRPDMGEITPNQVSSTRLFHPGGVLVDRSVSPNRVYVYDGANSRVLGMSHLGTCQIGGGPCTANSDCPGSVCAIQDGVGADLVLGQPSMTRSACNGDGNYQRYPQRATASAATLCGMPEHQVSTLEGGSFANMALDAAGNLYVPDWDNHRVLRYNSPFTTDTIADHVWGQANFAGNECNRGRGLGLPDDRSFCFRSPFNEGFTGGVGIDPAGNLWVTDNQNNRVLRFPKDPATGIPVSVADLVLGQPNFTSWERGSALGQMWAPAAVRVDGAGTVYVADAQPGGGADLGGRILVFNAPLSSGMNAGSTFGGDLRNPSGLEFDPGGGIWVHDFNNNQLLLFVGGAVQKVLYKDVPDYSGACGGPYSGNGPLVYYPGTDAYFDTSNVCGSRGSIGIDSDGNLIVAASSVWQDVWRFSAPLPDPTPGTAHSADALLFKAHQFGVHNQRGLVGLNSPRGVAVAAGQLIVSDAGRLSFWNNPSSLANGQVSDGYVGVVDPQVQSDNVFGRIRPDGASRLWATRQDKIVAYALPLTTGAAPIATLTSPLPVLGGGTISWDESLVIGGVAPVGTGQKLWVATPRFHRVFRIRDPLTNPVVDIVLGQTNASGTACNQGRGPTSPSQDSLCEPGAVTLDPQGNLYVSDHALEVGGNHRLLEYDASLFPDSPATAIFAVPASRVFGRAGSFTDPECRDALCGPFEPAFSSAGHMVVGMNTYLGSRFPLVYNNPLVSQEVDTYLNDYSSMSFAVTFDAANNLYVVDLNRHRVLIYKNPFNIP